MVNYIPLSARRGRDTERGRLLTHPVPLPTQLDNNTRKCNKMQRDATISRIFSLPQRRRTSHPPAPRALSRQLDRQERMVYHGPASPKSRTIAT